MHEFGVMIHRKILCRNGFPMNFFRLMELFEVAMSFHLSQHKRFRCDGSKCQVLIGAGFNTFQFGD